MQFVADPEEIIIGGFELFALGGADEFALFQIRERPRAVFEEGHPQEILIITQAAAAVLNIRLLHTGGIAELGAAAGLILQPRGDIFVLVPGHAFGDGGFLKFDDNGSLP